MAFLPSKQFALTAGALALTAAVVGIAYAFSNTEGTADSSPAAGEGTLGAVTGVSVEVSDHLSAQDTDGDGLKDWEETLWDTNPRNPDTDGDGTPDGEEVERGRHPATPGPDDALVNEGGALSRAANENLDTTDQFAREVFSTYLTQRTSGQPVSANVQEALVDSLFANAAGGENRTYARADLTVMPNAEVEDIRAYGNTLGAIVHRHSFETENEAEILRKSLQTENEELLTRLNPIVEGYGKIVADTAETAVPEGAADMHVDYLNALADTGQAIGGMGSAYTDPAQALASLKQHREAGQALADALARLRAYFAGHGIQFASDEFGAVLFHTP